MRNIRIFRYDRDEGKYSYEDYRGTAVMEEGIASEDGGVRRQCSGSVRIMTAAELSAKPGDYVSLRGEESIDKDRDFMVTSVKDNRRGRLPHWRLLVSGGRRS